MNEPVSTTPKDDVRDRALRLARPIVEGDLSTAREYSDADWIGMSKEALNAIDAALATTPPATAEAQREAIARIVDPEALTYRWSGSEDEQLAERMKACRERRQQWGDDECDGDGSCDECAFDMAKALEIPESKARRADAYARADAILATLLPAPVDGGSK